MIRCPRLLRLVVFVSVGNAALLFEAPAKLLAQQANVLPQQQSRPIFSVHVGAPVTVPDNYGDTWITALADDGNLYTPSNDTFEFHALDSFNREQINQLLTDYNSFIKPLSEGERLRLGKMDP